MAGVGGAALGGPAVAQGGAVQAPAGHDGVDVHGRDGHRGPHRRPQPLRDPPVELADEAPDGLLVRQAGDGVGQPLDLAPQLQRGGQQRLGREPSRRR